jgi:hypothetical protein
LSLVAVLGILTVRYLSLWRCWVSDRSGARVLRTRRSSSFALLYNLLLSFRGVALYPLELEVVDKVVEG